MYISSPTSIAAVGSAPEASIDATLESTNRNATAYSRLGSSDATSACASRNSELFTGEAATNETMVP